MGEFIAEAIGGAILWFFGTIIWNIWKGIGTSVRWCFFLGKIPIKEIWDHPDNGLVGFLTLVIGIISFFIIRANMM